MVYICWFIVDDHFKKNNNTENVNVYLFFYWLAIVLFTALFPVLDWLCQQLEKIYTYMVALCRLMSLSKKTPNGPC